MRRLFLSCVLLVVGCGGGNSSMCDLTKPTEGCESGKVCEEVGGMPACTAPLVVRGTVTSSAGGAPIPDALVAALDVNDAPASGTVKTDATGKYELRVPTPRDADGKPAIQAIKLRGAAAAYETFPSGLHRALPVESSTAVLMDGKYVLQSSATDISLTPIDNATGLGSIAGTVNAGAGKSGALVVAEGPATLTTVSDLDGAYVIFNVPAGSYTVNGYEAGVQLLPASATVAGAPLTGIDLNVASTPPGTPLGSVSGSIDFADAPGGSMTSVVLVVESTFNDVLKRGAVPPGLRAPKSGPPDVTGAFTITDVPDGKYVVLAAFENDGLVRDPDTSIGGTTIQRVTVAGAPVTLTAMFKVTGALKVISPGANDVPDEVTGTPTFVWGDDSSEDHYVVEVFDTRGESKWMNNMVFDPKNGTHQVSATYAGPALVSGAYYQFRATSISRAGDALSQTEDLRGVFIAK